MKYTVIFKITFLVSAHEGVIHLRVEYLLPWGEEHPRELEGNTREVEKILQIYKDLVKMKTICNILFS